MIPAGHLPGAGHVEILQSVMRAYRSMSKWMRRTEVIGLVVVPFAQSSGTVLLTKASFVPSGDQEGTLMVPCPP